MTRLKNDAGTELYVLLNQGRSRARRPFGSTTTEAAMSVGSSTKAQSSPSMTSVSQRPLFPSAREVPVCGDGRAANGGLVLTAGGDASIEAGELPCG